MTFLHYFRAFCGIVWRELLRFLQQRERFLAALVRPLIWLIIFAAGFRAALGISIIPPYETYITYDVYITPGLLAMRLRVSGARWMALAPASMSSMGYKSRFSGPL